MFYFNFTGVEKGGKNEGKTMKGSWSRINEQWRNYGWNYLRMKRLNYMKPEDTERIVFRNPYTSMNL